MCGGSGYFTIANRAGKRTCHCRVGQQRRAEILRKKSIEIIEAWDRIDPGGQGSA